MTGHGNVAMSARALNLALHGMHIGNRRIVKIFSPDEGRQSLEELLSQRNIARDGTRLDECRALPFWPTDS